MSRKHAHLSLVIDEVVADATNASQRRARETEVVKTAAAQPRTEVARGLRALAADLRANTGDITYADLTRSA